MGAKRGEQGAGFADITCGLATLDRVEDRFQQRPGFADRILAPQSGKVDGGTKLRHSTFLLARDLDGLEETGLRPRPVRLRPREFEPTVEAIQFGKPKALPRPFNGKAKPCFNVASAPLTSLVLSKASAS